MPAWGHYCPRCGLDPDDIKCVHTFIKGVIMTADEASHVRARYEIDRRFNPDHDTTSYRDGALLKSSASGAQGEKS